MKYDVLVLFASIIAAGISGFVLRASYECMYWHQIDLAISAGTFAVGGIALCIIFILLLHD